MHSAEKDTFYYDSHCPSSYRQAERLRQIADEGLVLADIHDLAQDPTLPPRQLLLKRSHLRRADQTLVSGLNANIAAWQHTRRGWLWRCLHAPVIARAAINLHEWRAHRRYLNLYGKRTQRDASRHTAAPRNTFDFQLHPGLSTARRTGLAGECLADYT